MVERRADGPDIETVTAFLGGRHTHIDGVERLAGGFWSSAWAYRGDGEDLVVRFGPDPEWYEADRKAMAFAGPDLPVPEVRDIGRRSDGSAWAISVRHHGTFLEDVPAGRSAPLAATLTRLLTALHHAPVPPDTPVSWHRPGASPASWQEHLLAGLVDDPGAVTHGWKATLDSDRALAALSRRAEARIRALVTDCPERRDLVHGDLLHGNVLLRPEADRVEAVFSWKCSVLGDFLYDAAWCTFWSPWHEGIAATDPLADVLAAPGVAADPTAVADAALRHHCYELHIGFTHLGWNIWTGDRTSLDATARRLGQILERGPVPSSGRSPASPG